MWAKGKVVMGIKTKRIVLRHLFINLSSALFVRMTKMTRRDRKALTTHRLIDSNLVFFSSSFLFFPHS